MIFNTYDIKKVFNDRVSGSLISALNKHGMQFQKQMHVPSVGPNGKPITAIKNISHYNSENTIKLFQRLIREKEIKGNNQKVIKAWKDTIDKIKKVEVYMVNK